MAAQKKPKKDKSASNDQRPNRKKWGRHHRSDDSEPVGHNHTGRTKPGYLDGKYGYSFERVVRMAKEQGVAVSVVLEKLAEHQADRRQRSREKKRGPIARVPQQRAPVKQMKPKAGAGSRARQTRGEV